MVNTKKKSRHVYEGRDLEAMDFALKYHEWILDLFKPYLGKKIVEVGAGSGSFTELIFNLRPLKVIAIEPSTEMYPLLVQSLEEYKDKAMTYKAFFSDVASNIKKEKPDSIVYVNVFEHIENDNDELKTLYDTLPRGGRICIFVPANRFLMSDFDRKIGHFRRYTKKELKNKVESAGFSIKMYKRFDAAGILPWLIKFRLFKSVNMEPGLTKLYDVVVVPIQRIIEKLLPPFVGKNLILVAEKP